MEPTTTATRAATRRFAFVGVTTGKSAIMRVFPAWAEHLGLGNVEMRGHDLPMHAEPAALPRGRRLPSRPIRSTAAAS